MKIKHSTWRRFCRIIGYLFFPFGVLDFIRPNWWSETDWNISIGVFFIVGFAGALVAILVRTGKIEFVYSEKDVKKSYKMSKFIAGQERQNSSIKDLYSEKYYESFNDSKTSESDDKSSSDK